MRRRSNVDETARAVSAFFQEILGAGQTQALSAFGASPGEEREAISSRQFLHFFAHYKVFTQDFTHVHALQVYNDEADNDPDGVLDLTGFKTALGTVAQLLKDSNIANRPSLRGTLSNPMEESRTMTSSPTKGQELAALDELVQEINSRRDFTIDPAAHALMTPLYDVEVVQATYSYSGMLRGLFNHFATADNQVMELGGPSSMASSLGRASRVPISPSKLSKKLPPAVNGRSFYRLCCALGMVPNCIVEGELSDMMAKRSMEGKGKSHTRSGTFGDKPQMNSETRYFEDNLMVDGTDEYAWQGPAKGFMPGEPRYSFPELVENLVLAAFTVPPRPFSETTKVRVQRIHEIFSGALRLPSFALDTDFLLKPYCLETISQKRVEEFLAEHLKVLTAKKKRQPSNNEMVGITMDIATVFARLSHDLPNLPMRRDIHIPKPPPHKELPPQPETLDEKLARPAGKQAQTGKSKGGKGKKKKKGGGKAAKKVKRKLGVHDMNKVIFYAKREPPKRPDLPPQLCIDRRAQMIEELDMRLHQKTEELKALTVPRREGLRMTLIDESLRAPRCSNEEVSTLMETALTARRLRHYEEAIALLIRARTLWSAIEAGRNLPAVNWTDVQPLVPTPSPWGTGFVSSATRVTLTEGGRSARGDCSGSCRDALPGPEEKGMAIKQGNAVFRRFQTTCASAHLQRRTGATAALAAAAAAAAANGTSIEGEGSREEHFASTYAEGDVDRTILPEELARSSKGTSAAAGSKQGLLGAPAAPMTAWMSASEASGSQLPLPPTGTSSKEMTESPYSSLQPQPPPPRQGDLQGQRTSRPASAFSGRRYSKQSADTSVAPAPLATRRYSPQVDFHLAIGEDNPDLSKLPPEANIFFYCELASLHSAIREDERAVQLLWLARGPSDRLPSNHPDCAVVWCAFGRLAFLLGAFDIAARATARGRKLRERILGGDTMETATSHNNLACCLFALDRPMEALAHLELAQEILKILAGEDHPRTQTTLRNLEKARVAQKHLHAEVPHLFSFYVPQEKSRGRSRKKKKKGGSSRGSSRRSSSAASSRRSSRKGK